MASALVAFAPARLSRSPPSRVAARVPAAGPPPGVVVARLAPPRRVAARLPARLGVRAARPRRVPRAPRPATPARPAAASGSSTPGITPRDDDDDRRASHARAMHAAAKEEAEAAADDPDHPSRARGSRAALACAFVAATAVALLAAANGATPLADLPRPSYWAVMHSTAEGVRGVKFTPQGALRFLDYFGTALFAQAGVAQAGKSGMDFLGCLIVGCVTAMGGGTFRGFVLGERPVFWAAEPDYLFISLVASALSFVWWPRVERRFGRDPTSRRLLDECLNWGDAISIGAFAVIGANNGLRGANGNPLVAVACGMFTASFGGIMRDTFCGVPARILHSHREAYASLTSMGAALYVTLASMQVSLELRIAAPICLVVALRVAAWKKGLRMPTYDDDAGGDDA